MSTDLTGPRLVLSEDLDPWDRQPGERKTRYYFFGIYRDMPPHIRSVRKVAEAVGKGNTTLSRYAWQDRWVERAEAWDSSLDLERRAAAKQAILDMEARHAQIASLMLSKVAQRLVGDPAANVEPIDPNRLTPNDLARIAEVATKVERIARGAEKEADDLKDGVKLKVAFEFNPAYPEDRGDVELPPEQYKELPGIDEEVP